MHHYLLVMKIRDITQLNVKCTVYLIGLEPNKKQFF